MKTRNRKRPVGSSNRKRRLAQPADQRNAMLGIVDCLPVGLLLSDERGQVMFSNATAAEIIGLKDGLRVLRGELRATVAKEDEELRASMAQAANGAAKSRRQATSALAITRPSGGRPFGLMIAPLPNGNGAGKPVIGVFVSDPDQRADLPIDMLRRLYGFTPAEAKLAALLAAGLRIEDAATELGISVHTARAQLKQVFAKTKTHRQPALVRMILMGPAALRMDRAGRSQRRLTS